jgi:hypothetical protein
VAGRSLAPQIRNNFKATAPPTPDDSVVYGFQIGSRWIIKTTSEGWECRGNDPGAAVWIKIGFGGRPSKEDQGWAALTTVSNGDLASNETVSTDLLGSVKVEVNGHGVGVGDAAKDEACYFSGDGGITPRARDGVKAGDKLYWNGSIAEYQLEPDDRIDLFYDIQ